ncbi:MAG: ferrous iron transport protein B [Candidatus Omnitrophica bacterium]|nr:ferrous iron transport protein B [Candidatus Omnitrophota bacterium]
MARKRIRLTEADPGAELLLVSIEGGQGLAKKLTDMGLIPGERIRKLEHSGKGPVMLIVKGSKLALGRGMADKVIVAEEYIKKTITVAIAGNPNAGKTSIFNNLTGARQHVGNYPGVTVERKEGIASYKDYEIKVVDLPGAYSLTAYSLDEMVARKFVIEEKPDLIVDIVDASNLERNLYLATQFMELELPMVLVLNMSDVAKNIGQDIDEKALSELLGMRVVSTVGNKNIGTTQLLETIVQAYENRTRHRRVAVNYGREVEEEITKIHNLLAEETEVYQRYPLRWLVLKLLEEDREVHEYIKGLPDSEKIIGQTEKSRAHLKSIFADETETVLADRRYGFISGTLKETVGHTAEAHIRLSDKIDKVVANRVAGIPIFLGIMWLMFKAIFTLSEPMMAWIEKAQSWLAVTATSVLPQDSILEGLVVDGIIGGVGSVLVFVPIIFLLFFCISLLEDSGYMARIAFIVDRFMHKIGLHGRSFIPMLLGFGCNVPAIMATRVIESRKDRLTTILINPFMSCGARLPVYVLFIGAFFRKEIAGNVLFSIYLVGFVMAVIVAKLLRRFVFTGPSAPFVMELPPYRMPTIKALFIHVWERGWLYLKKAGTVIFIGCLIVWFLSSFPLSAEGDLNKSYVAKIGKTIEPIVRPLGFDWKVATALVSGVVAKEIVVGTLGVLYKTEEQEKGEESVGLRKALQQDSYPDGSKVFSPLMAYALMLFVLLYIPCLATFAVIRKEAGSWGWAFFSLGYSTALAWSVAFVVYQGGRLLGL